ncbi:MAG: nuclease family protein [Ilumatobacteraceae bacterium]|nr:nuclease family protein [Ilumatobacteraceae bacterium]
MASAQGQWVRYGTEAATALRAQISRIKADEALAPVTVVVPSNQVGVSTRRLLASGAVGSISGAGPGLIGITFVTPYRLAELLGAASLAAQGRRPVSVPVLGAAVRLALAEEPGTFGPVADHAATETALVAAHRELRDLDPQALSALAASSTRAGEVVRVHQAARRHLAERWYDEEDLLAAAATAVLNGQTPADLGAVVVHLPQRLSRHAAELLVALGRATELTVIAGATGVAKADADVVRSVGRLGADIGPPPSRSALPDLVDPNRTRIITASDADDEVRAAVRTVIDAVRAGTSLDRVAVLYAAPEPYGRLLQHHLDAAGVLTNGTATLPLAGRAAGRTLLGLLDLPATGFRRQDVFAWLSGAPILFEGRRAPVTSWERASRDAGVILGRSEWDRRLQHLAARRTEVADARQAQGPDDEPPGWRVTRDRDEAVRALELRRFVLGLADRLAAAANAPAPWSDRVRWAKRLLTELLGGPARRAGWPDAERRGAERVELALDRLAALDQIEGPVSLAVFGRALAGELEADLGRVGRFGEGVLVGPVSMGVGVDVDLVVTVGMAEGTFPATLRDDSLLPDDDRGATAGELPLRSGHVDRLHQQFLAVLAGARTHVLCVPKGDLRRSRNRVASRWVLEIASLLAGETLWSDALATHEAPWITHHASFDDTLRTAAPATDQEHRLRHLLALAPRRTDLEPAAAEVDPSGPLLGGVHALGQRGSARFTRFDGNLTGLDVASLTERGTSATSLEQWARCPHGYFIRQVLGVRPLEQPEDSLQITPIDRGKLVHTALEDFIREAIDEDRIPAPGHPWSAADHQRLATIANDHCDAAEAGGLTGRALFWQRDRLKILVDLERFLRSDDDHRAATGARPIAAELAFGGDEPWLEFPLGDGRTVRLRGNADRIDRGADGTLHVLDYKTGKADKFTGISAADPHQGGQHLQLAVYGLAARHAVGSPAAPVRADYWFTSARGGFRKLGYDLTDEVLDTVSAAAATIVDGIGSGLFPPHPSPPTTSPYVDCHACDPDGLGTTELLRHWDRKHDDPLLAPYVALVEPADADPVGAPA